jgi:hypothetical protein
MVYATGASVALGVNDCVQVMVVALVGLQLGVPVKAPPAVEPNVTAPVGVFPLPVQVSVAVTSVGVPVPEFSLAGFTLTTVKVGVC